MLYRLPYEDNIKYLDPHVGDIDDLIEELVKYYIPIEYAPISWRGLKDIKRLPTPTSEDLDKMSRKLSQNLGQPFHVIAGLDVDITPRTKKYGGGLIGGRKKYAEGTTPLTFNQQYHLDTIRLGLVLQDKQGNPVTAKTIGVEYKDKIYNLPSYNRRGGFFTPEELRKKYEIEMETGIIQGYPKEFDGPIENHPANIAARAEHEMMDNDRKAALEAVKYGGGFKEGVKSAIKAIIPGLAEGGVVGEMDRLGFSAGSYIAPARGLVKMIRGLHNEKPYTNQDLIDNWQALKDKDKIELYEKVRSLPTAKRKDLEELRKDYFNLRRNMQKVQTILYRRKNPWESGKKSFRKEITESSRKFLLEEEERMEKIASQIDRILSPLVSRKDFKMTVFNTHPLPDKALKYLKQTHNLDNIVTEADIFKQAGDDILLEYYNTFLRSGRAVQKLSFIDLVDEFELLLPHYSVKIKDYDK
jgi:hypothetical protein